MARRHVALTFGRPLMSTGRVDQSPVRTAGGTDRSAWPSTSGFVVHICHSDVVRARLESDRVGMGINGHTASTRRAAITDEQHTLRLRDPGDLLEAVPYLIGFHPYDSLVVVGLEGEQVAVTLRVDIGDGDLQLVAANLVEVLQRADVDSVILVIYQDFPEPLQSESFGASTDCLPALPGQSFVDDVTRALRRGGLQLLDSLLVCQGRWWSYLGRASGCECCVAGNALPGLRSPAAASAVFAGLVVHPTRDALQAVIEPADEADRERRREVIRAREDVVEQVTFDGQLGREQRSVKRALFAAAREADASLLPRLSLALPDHELCRYAVALTDIAVRDSLWLAVDQGRIDGRGLWQTLLRSLPSPYDCAPLFLFGWASWREGQGSLAAMAAERALESDPSYYAAQLLASAVQHGLNPFRTPRLRIPSRSAAGPRASAVPVARTQRP
jgi:Domain of unknown function (DUF4192)